MTRCLRTIEVPEEAAEVVALEAQGSRSGLVVVR
jgi:hypothetical protein